MEGLNWAKLPPAGFFPPPSKLYLRILFGRGIYFLKKKGKKQILANAVANTHTEKRGNNSPPALTVCLIYTHISIFFLITYHLGTVLSGPYRSHKKKFKINIVERRKEVRSKPIIEDKAPEANQPFGNGHGCRQGLHTGLQMERKRPEGLKLHQQPREQPQGLKEKGRREMPETDSNGLTMMNGLWLVLKNPHSVRGPGRKQTSTA
jgi:hypothetical protein